MRSQIWLSLWCIFFCWGQSANAQTSIPNSNVDKEASSNKSKTNAKNTPGKKKSSHRDLTIVLIDFPASDYVSNKEIKFDGVCRDFSRYLTGNRGLWGTGPFRKTNCFVGDKTTPKSPRSWRLEVSGDRSIKKFEIFFVDPKGVSYLESSLILETELTPIALLSVKRTRALIAAALTLGLPFRSVVKKSVIGQGGSIKLSGIKFKDLPPPKANLQIFSLNRNLGFWKPNIVGAAELITDGGDGSSYKISLLGSGSSIAGNLNAANGMLYLQQGENRGEDRERIEDALRQDLGGFLRRLIGFARAVYVGGRYGYPLGRSPGVLSKASTVGFFGEFRGGMFQGVKFNYDSIPLQRSLNDSAVQKFSWSRVQVGYGFGRRFNNRFFNWIDLTPKIGVTNLEYTQSEGALSGGPGFSFNLFRAPTLGAEVGIEKRTPYFLARLWTYGSYSIGIFKEDKTYTSSSLRVGFDVYRDLFSLGIIKVALLGFGAADTSTFTRSASEAELGRDPSLVTNFKYQSIYAGGGLTITW